MSQQYVHQHTSPPGGGPDGEQAAVRRLRQEVDGAVHVPLEAAYDTERQAPYAADLDPRPVAVVMAAGTADLVSALAVAREHDLPFAVQSSGHGTKADSTGGILVKTGHLSGVLVDPERRLARAGAGAVWGQVIAAADPLGLAPLAGTHGTVGVAGYTLGGGISWLSRPHGFAADSLVRAEVITADGRVLTASADSHPDLFWALRGGGGNFGVVTSLEFRLHPVAELFAGAVFFPAERAADLLARYRDWVGSAPDALSTALLLTRLPEDGQTPAALVGTRVAGVQVMHDGPAEEARRLLAPLLRAGGRPVLDTLRTGTFGGIEMGGIGPAHVNLLDTLPDPVIDILVETAARPDSPVSSVQIRHWGGAMSRPGPDAGPVGHRTARFSAILDARLPEVEEVMREHTAGRAFLNFLADPGNAVAAYTPDDYRKLREVKRAYDPDNVFRVNYNIPPA
ncbi:FAD-binding oxidoreductase [Nonomuraea candida]|uniref:FAD-binding oxidoreductase n=1 Tax=Nonomuraea candida TaxID=359159 RepID=UPI0009FE6527|nr:FAD-binding oxidoreductase [Nonomuraea candida]